MDHKEEKFLFLKNWIENLESHTIQCPFPFESPLNKFLEDIYHVGVSFYMGIETWQVCFSLLEELPKRKIELTFQEKYLDDRLLQEVHQINYQGSINRLLIIDAWSVFESNLYDVIREYLNQETIVYLCKQGVREYMSLVKRSEVVGLDLAKIDKKRTVNEVSKLPIPYLLTEVFKLCENYQGDYKEDIKFLENLGRWRNMMHNSFVNYGTELDFSVGRFRYFVPRNGSITLLDSDGNQVSHISGFPLLIDRLIEIWENFSLSIKAQNDTGLSPIA
jgi:hypothetical protein